MDCVIEKDVFVVRFGDLLCYCFVVDCVVNGDYVIEELGKYDLLVIVDFG